MAGILREFRCSVHGDFESRSKKPRCPYGCSTVMWCPKTPPSIRTNTVTKQMDALQYQIAAEQGLSDMRVRYEGESVAGNRIQTPAPAPAFSNPQEYMAAVAQGKAPPTGMWGAPSQVGLRQPTEDERKQITPTVEFADDPAARRVPAIVDKAYLGNPTAERQTVADLVRSGNV